MGGLCSGNPAGRPRGTRNAATIFNEALREGEAEQVVRKFVERALAGDRVAERICFERLVPRLRGAPVEFDLPEGAEHDAAAVLTALLRAAADGEVTAADAAILMRLVAARESAKLSRRAAAAPALRPAREPGAARAADSRAATTPQPRPQSPPSGAAAESARAAPVSGLKWPAALRPLAQDFLATTGLATVSRHAPAT
jgi:Family of unknown function (DUF5681)